MRQNILEPMLAQRLDLLEAQNRALNADNSKLQAALTEATRRQRESRHLAEHDDLTGLANRRALEARLHESLAEAQATQQRLALIFIDLDGFKQVNDRHGHACGDKLLGIVATRIANCVRAQDLACRYGGDEFVVMLTHLGDAATASGVAAEIAARIDGRYCIDGQDFAISASIGLACFPEDGALSQELLSHADASMYRCKQARAASPSPAAHSALAA